MFKKKSPSKDSDGVNMVDIDWSYSKDIQSISKYLKLLDKEIREKIGKVFYKNFHQNKFQCNFLHSHFIGTTRMEVVKEIVFVINLGKFTEYLIYG